MPTGVLIPVESMSMRVLIGMVQALVTPGRRTVASSSANSRATVMPGRHWSGGLSVMMVSIIDSGAGSVAVSARPTLPNTVSTSGTWRIIRSVCCRISRALVMDRPGSVVGMYRMSPSLSGGMNSEPNWRSGTRVTANTAPAPTRTSALRRRMKRMTGA